MIEDKESGIKIAIDDEEEYWIKLEDEAKKRIKSFEREIIIHREILALAISKQKERQEVDKYGE